MTAHGTALSVWDPRVAPEENAANWRREPVVQPARKKITDGKPLLVDLFCGAGGFSVGLEQAGFQSVLGIDHNAPAIDTHHLNHPHAATILGDIRRVTDTIIRDVVGAREIALLTAGVPCQGFSICNRKRHDGDTRNLLFREFIRVVRALRPRAVVLENVSTLQSAASGGFARAIAAEIAASGYRVESRLLNAVEFGVPQTRRRLFFIGLRDASTIAWPEPTHGEGQTSSVTVWDALSDLPALASGECAERHTAPAATAYQRLMRNGTRRLHNHRAPRHPPATIERIARTPPGEPMYPRFRQRIRLDPDAPSPTQVAGGIRPQFSLGHPTQPRGLTVRERCRLQSFPDGHEITGGIVQGRVQTGNAVPPLLAEAIGRALRPQIE